MAALRGPRASSGSTLDQGRRYSWGYPACPDQSEHEKVWRLLGLEEIGMTLSGGYAVMPEQSTVAIVAHHPQAVYFGMKSGFIPEDKAPDELIAGTERGGELPPEAEPDDGAEEGAGRGRRAAGLGAERAQAAAGRAATRFRWDFRIFADSPTGRRNRAIAELAARQHAVSSPGDQLLGVGLSDARSRSALACSHDAPGLPRRLRASGIPCDRPSGPDAGGHLACGPGADASPHGCRRRAART